MTTRPSVIVFDVNETLSDMGPLADAFTRAGVPASLARLWFTEVLRDGFALTSAGDNPAFADLATDSLHRLLTQTSGPGDYQEQVDSIMAVFTNLSLHPDAGPGISALSRITQLITLSNGATSVAESLLSRGGVQDKFSRFLSVQDAPRWKPAREAYDYAARETGQTVDQLLLVAVHPWDIHGANTAGLKTAWINRTGASYPSYFTAPDIEAEDLVTLAGKLTGS
ncbi:2-haloacid dehalogenase [Arthrobacter sp. CAN_A6]|uniref:haloacid dehalogenase type II n=1 Tax=Arthrobacter sp. CAN_A6 TaxID=2787721 RepID=UPI0018CAAC75